MAAKENISDGIKQYWDSRRKYWNNPKPSFDDLLKPIPQMKPLHQDIINSWSFLKLADYIWDPTGHSPFVTEVLREYQHITSYRIGNKISSGIIYAGTNQYVEDLFEHLPRQGNFIVIHRDNDRPFTREYYMKMPLSVRHIYTVNSQITAPNVTAIPTGMAFAGFKALQTVCEEQVEKSERQIFCRQNVNAGTPERKEALNWLRENPIATVAENQMSAEDFYRQIKAHKLTLSLQGLGKDCLRTYEAMVLGSIPIVTDCIEMRHFDDMPMVRLANIEFLTKNWCDEQNIIGKTNERLRMSYWENEINEKRNEIIKG